MVFFTCMIIVLILYYLQADGLIYVTVLAVFAELINLFMTQTLTKSVEKKTADKYIRIINSHKATITTQKKRISELEKIRDDSVHKLYKANAAIKTYEQQLGIEESQTLDIPVRQKKKAPPDITAENPVPKGNPAGPEAPEKTEFIDLPAGSNRKKLPI